MGDGGPRLKRIMKKTMNQTGSQMDLATSPPSPAVAPAPTLPAAAPPSAAGSQPRLIASLTHCSMSVQLDEREVHGGPSWKTPWLSPRRAALASTAYVAVIEAGGATSSTIPRAESGPAMPMNGRRRPHGVRRLSVQCPMPKVRRRSNAFEAIRVTIAACSGMPKTSV